MSNENTPSQSTKNTLDSEFRFSSIGGPVLGIDLKERQSILILNESAGVVRLEKHRSESNAEEEPIGVFEAPLEPGLFARIVDLADSVGLDQLKPGVRGGPGASVLTFKYVHENTGYEKSISTFDHEQITNIEPLLDELYSAQTKLLSNPATAIVASIQHVGNFNVGHFELTVRNIGTAPLYVADPRWLDNDLDNWAGVRVAILPEEIPGVTSGPLEWEQVYIAKPQYPMPESVDVLLQPQTEVSFPTERWVPKRSGNRYIIQGIYTSYQGPKEINGVYRVRGAVFSKAIEKQY